MIFRSRKLLICLTMVLAGGGHINADPIIVAHRGNSLFYPENTIESINGSEGFADYVEVDVHTSLDGALVLIHDNTLERTTNGNGNVSHYTLENLKALDAGSKFDSTLFAGAKIPTLAEGIAAAKAKNLKLLIEIKSAAASDIYNAISSANAFSDVAVQSFNATVIEQLHGLDTGSQLKLGILSGSAPTVENLDSAKLKGASFVALDHNVIDADAVALVKSKNLEIFVWTVNGAALQRKIELDVDGVITDDPKLAHNILAKPARTNLNDGLVAYWKMDDGQGGTPTTVLDSVYAGSNGTPSNSPSWVPGKFGGSVSFAGNNTTVQSVQIPNTPALNPATNELTMSMWVRFDQMTGEFDSSKNWGSVFNSNNGQDYYIIYQDKSISGLRFKVSNAGATITTSRANILDSDLVKGEWMHLVAVYDGNWSGLAGELLFYVNGKLRGNKVGQETPNLNGKGFKGIIPNGQIAAFGAKGANGPAAQGFNGGIDDAAIWKRALTGTDIQYIYNEGLNNRSLEDLRITADVVNWSVY